MTDIFTGTEELSLKETELVYKTYLMCNLQQRAYETIVKNVLSADLRWVHDRKSSMTVANDPIDKFSVEYNIFRRFLKDVILQIKLFGYVIYRMTQTKKANDSTNESTARGTDSSRKDGSTNGSTTSDSNGNGPVDIDGGLKLEVANGSCSKICFNARKNEWEVKCVNGSPVKRKTWQLEIFTEPYRIGPRNETKLNSSSSQCQMFSEMYQSMVKRANERDNINSNPFILTSLSHEEDKQPQSTGLPYDINVTTQNFNDHLEERISKLRKLHNLSEKARELTRSSYTSFPRKSKEKMDKPDVDKPNEILVSDGMKFEQLHARQDPAHFQQILKELSNSVFYSWEVTPQFYGIPGGSERLTSNDRLAQISIHNTLGWFLFANARVTYYFLMS